MGKPPHTEAAVTHILHRTGLRHCAVLFTLACLLFQLGAGAPVYAAAAVAVDQHGGYSAKMLDKVSAIWAPPPGLKGEFQVRLKVSLDGSGKVQQCVPVKSSGMEALDASACGAVSTSGPHGTPPYGMPLDIYLHFWTGTPKGQARPDILSTEEAMRAEIMARTKAEQAMGRQRADEAEARARERAEAAALSAGQTLPEVTSAPIAQLAPTKSRAKPKPGTSAVPAASDGGGVLIKAPTKKQEQAPALAAKTTPAQATQPAQAASTARVMPTGQTEQTALAGQAKASPPAAAPAVQTMPQGSTAQASTPPQGRVILPLPQSASGLPLADGLKAQEKFEPKYRKYLADAAYNLREAMFIPAETALGTYYATARIEVTPEGKISKYALTESSGDATLDKFVLQGIRRAGSVAAPPAGFGKTLEITFTLIRR